MKKMICVLLTCMLCTWFLSPFAAGAAEEGITAIDLSRTQSGLAFDETATVMVMGMTAEGPVTLSNAELSFASSDEAVIRVGEDGIITPVGIGTAKLTVSLGNMRDSMRITVYREKKDGEDFSQLGDHYQSDAFVYDSEIRRGDSGNSLHVKSKSSDFSEELPYLFPATPEDVTKGVSEFWFYNNGQNADNKTHLFFIQARQGNSVFRIWVDQRGNRYYINNKSKGDSPTQFYFTEDNEMYSQTAPVKVGWNQFLIDYTSDRFEIYINGSLWAQIVPANGTMVDGLSNVVFYRQENTPNDVWVDDYAVYNMTCPPSVRGVGIRGKAEPGEVLEGFYTYHPGFGAEAVPEDTSTVQWLASDTADGTYTEVASTLDYTVAESDRFLKFRVLCNGIEYSSDPAEVKGAGETEETRALFVATDGSDTNDGSIDAPYATLERARNEIRSLNAAGQVPDGGITVYLRGGTYHPSQTFTLSREDSGTADRPVIYRAYRDEKVTISGGNELDYSKFAPVAGEMKTKLRSAEAREAVLTADLSVLGMNNPGKYTLNGNVINAPMFLFDGQIMHLSRYPNSDEIANWPIVEILNRGYCSRYPKDDYRQGEGLMKAQYKDEVLSSWSHNLSDIVYGGYWSTAWYAELLYANLDREAKTFEALGSMVYGGSSKDVGEDYRNRPFRVFNVYEELDEPGEWDIDREAGKLYIYPYPNDGVPQIKVTSLDAPLVSMTDASYITLYGIEFTGGRQTGINISGGEFCRVDSCDISVVESNGVNISGQNNGIANSHIHHTGNGGVYVTGGDRDTLTHANNYVKNCEINDFALLTEANVYGVRLNDSVGNSVQNCEIYNAPFLAILFQGSENVMEYNVIHDVVLNTADVGAIYTGRDFRDHGNVIRYNQFYSLGSPIHEGLRPAAVFTDDASSDLDVYGNVIGPLYDECHAFKVHAGQENHFYNNLFVDCAYLYYSYMWDDVKWANAITGVNNKEEYHDRLVEVNTNPLYLEKWPWLANTTDPKTIKNQGNTLRGNISIYVNTQPLQKPIYQHGNDSLVLKGVDDGQTNLFLTNQSKGLFADYDNHDLRVGQEIYDLVPGFEPIPFDQIGLYSDTDTPPYATNVAVKGKAMIGTVLRGSYTYLDAQGDLEGNSAFTWEISALPDGPFTSCGMERTLEINDSMLGKYVRFGVAVMDEGGRTGETVWSAPFAVVLDKSSYEAILDNIIKEKAACTVGTALGQYPATAAEAFQLAIDAAQGVYEDENASAEDYQTAIGTLTAAYTAFAEARIRSVSTTEEEVSIPQGLEDVQIDAGILYNLTLEAVGGVFPHTTVSGTLGGKAVQFTIEQGFRAAGGKLELIRALEKPSQTLFGDPIYAVFTIGKGSSPIAVAFMDADDLDIVRQTGEGYEKLPTSFTADGGEYAVTKLYTPSDDALLQAVYLDGKAFNRFRANTFQYKYNVSGNTPPVVTAETRDSNASLEITQAATVPGTATVIVTAQNGKKQTYTIDMVKKQETVTEPGGGGFTGGGNRNESYGTGSSLLGTEPVPVFGDIAGHWAQSDIEEMYRRGVVSGVTDTTFEPDRAVTRAEFATLVSRALGLTASPSGFSDTEPGAWYDGYAGAVSAAGLMQGYDNQFRPDDLITREEMAVVVAKAGDYLGKTFSSGGLEKFMDQNEISGWAVPYVDAVTTAGIISGMTPTTFVAKSYTTRAQAAVVLKRVLD